MVRSRLPVASLLSLFLTLSPELLMGTPGGPSEVPVNSANYFKVVNMVKEVNGMEHHFLVDLAETTCKKRPGLEIVYENVQKCEPLPESQKRQNCFLKVIVLSPTNEMYLAMPSCTQSGRP